ncbi:MAG: porin family protein [Nitrospira sp. SB0672_bin_25]|nr:porin family protein [Nitrospira sp. SB0678_bin_10]MYJ54762.1 porin family protein [Nitrospira sp. SB0672_bin_25]
MRTDPSWTVVSREPGLPPGMRAFSSALMKAVPAALAVVLLSFGASAYAGDGPYVGIGGGLSILNDSEVTAPMREGYDTPLNINATSNNGFAIRGMAGYAFPSGLRVEAEIDYRRHSTDQMDVRTPGTLVEAAVPAVAPAFGLDPLTATYADLPAPGQMAAAAAVTGSQPVDGAFSILAYMVNVDYDFDTGSRWVPYVGGGLGLATVSLDTKTEQGRSLADDSDTVFAYQVGAGLGYEFPLEASRSVTVSLDWRYFGTQTPTFKGDLTGTEFDVGFSGHDIGMSLIYGF